LVGADYRPDRPGVKMADDKHWVAGDYYRICERTGFKVRARRTRKEWTNRIIRDISWEPRQPQDFVRGVRDDQTVPEPRPRSVNAFQGPLGTYLTAPVVAGAFVIQVYQTIRMSDGDTITIMMDNGVNFVTTIYIVQSQTQLQLTQPFHIRPLSTPS
jgi:hypothetical protein